MLSAARAAGRRPLLAGPSVRTMSVMNKLRGMLGMAGGSDSSASIADFQKLDPAEIKAQVEQMTLDTFVAGKRSSLSGIKGKMIEFATKVDADAMLAQVEVEENILKAMSDAEKQNAANLTSGQMLAISRRSASPPDAVSQLLQTFVMSRAQLLILADMKERGAQIPSDPKALQDMLGQHAQRMIRESQLKPIDRGATKSRFYRR